jgi:urease accessory protein
VETTIPESKIKTANLELMREDAKKLRPDKSTLFLSLKDEIGIEEVVNFIREKALFK